MLIVDASCLYEVVADGVDAETIRARLATDDEQAAPHLVDAEVLSLIRRDHLRGMLDPTAARQAVEDLLSWPGLRYGHRGLLERAWELRTSLRSWDGLYVALAEALDGTLVTLDARLARASGPRCALEVLRRPG
ncbi:MAG TPA: type II toxin-antitoxin system VapC family toxin [Actinomycetota bacterium]